MRVSNALILLNREFYKVLVRNALIFMGDFLPLMKILFVPIGVVAAEAQRNFVNFGTKT